MTIQLPEYETIYPGAVHIRDRILHSVDGINEIPLSYLVLTQRYKLPTEDQVVEHIQKTALGLYIASRARLLDLNNTESEGGSGLETVIRRLPGAVVKEIKNGDEARIRFIRDATPVPAAEEGSLSPTYLLIRFGFLTPEIIDYHQEKGNIETAFWYDGALSHYSDGGVLGEKWAVYLELNNGALPEMAIVEESLNHAISGVVMICVTLGGGTINIDKLHHQSDGVKRVIVDRTFYSLAQEELIEDVYAEQIRDVIEAVYTALPTPEQVAQVRDASEDALEETSIISIFKLLNSIKEERDRAARNN